MGNPLPSHRPPRWASLADRVGVVGSLVCAVHCALVPLVAALLPASGLALLGGDADQTVVMFATVLAVTSLTVGFRRHRGFHAWMLMVPGLALLWLASFTGLHDHSGTHAGLMVTGGVLVAIAHLVNLRLSHRRQADAAAAGPAYY